MALPGRALFQHVNVVPVELGDRIDGDKSRAETRSCDRKTSGPTAAAGPALPLAEEIGRA